MEMEVGSESAVLHGQLPRIPRMTVGGQEGFALGAVGADGGYRGRGGLFGVLAAVLHLGRRPRMSWMGSNKALFFLTDGKCLIFLVFLRCCVISKLKIQLLSQFSSSEVSNARNTKVNCFSSITFSYIFI